MTSQESILIFQDTQKIIAENQDDHQHTLRMQASSQLYLENLHQRFAGSRETFRLKSLKIRPFSVQGNPQSLDCGQRF